MAIIFEEALKKNIAKDITTSVFILFGNDGYLKKNYAEKIADKIADKDDIFNFSKFIDSADLQEVYDSVMQFPIMADKKFVELCDFDFENCSKADFEKLCTLISEVPDTTVFCLRFDSFEFDFKKSKKFKSIKDAAEKNGGLVCQLDHRGTAELAKMLTNGAAKRNCKLDRAVAEYLIETSGDDINVLRNELNKLCAFAKEGIITKQTVDLVCVKTVEASIYNLTKHIFAKDVKAALSCLDELFFMKIAPMFILYSISSAYVDIFRYSSARENDIETSKIFEVFDYKGRDFLIEKAAQNFKKIDSKKLDLSLEALVSADKDMKSFNCDERIILEQLIVRLIYIAVKGDTIDKA